MLTEQHTKGDLKAFKDLLRKHKFRNATVITAETSASSLWKCPGRTYANEIREE